jgi:hypothetical protein
LLKSPVFPVANGVELAFGRSVTLSEPLTSNFSVEGSAFINNWLRYLLQKYLIFPAKRVDVPFWLCIMRIFPCWCSKQSAGKSKGYGFLVAAGDQKINSEKS